MRSRRLDALAIAIAGLLARLAVVLWAHARFPAVEDGHYYDVLARRIAGGDGYTWLWPDGAVTYVAHYPVGYPALVAAGYAIFGAALSVAMTTNALVGAAGAYAMHRLVDDHGIARWRPAGAALVVALHPALVPYTAALMTEAATAALLVVAASFATGARASADRDANAAPGAAPSAAPSVSASAWMAGAGLVLGLATLVRPQCLALAPVLGAFAVSGRAAARARCRAIAVVTLVAMICVAPWTVRNCERMNRCALVSVNGGWNLLIGATTRSGAWQPMSVPAECATVWDEAGKDDCFERAAWREIGRAPAAWMLRAPAKLAATFDYFGAAPWYLHASNADAFGEVAKVRLGALETAVCRLLLLGALVACGTLEGGRAGLRRALACVGAIGALTLHGWIGYVAIPVLVALMGWRAIARGPAVVPIAAAAIAATAATHAVFFGAGRYGLVIAPFVAGLAFLARGRAAVVAAGGTSGSAG